MICPGLVSVTFRRIFSIIRGRGTALRLPTWATARDRPYKLRRCVSPVIASGHHRPGATRRLKAIEWGGDIHVPYGDIARAREVRRATEDAGLRVAAYGSYYRVGHEEPGPFQTALETAMALGAPAIRVWAGKLWSHEADAAYWGRVVEDSRRIADLAADAGVNVAYEFHSRTLTDTNEAARALLQAAAHPNIKTYWQPPQGSTVQYNLAGVDAVAPWLLNIHVFHWRREEGDPPRVVRLPLAEGETAWRQYLRRIADIDRDHYALLEFVRDDAAEAFLQDAAVFRRWLA